MEVDLQSLFGSCVLLYSLADTPQLPPLTPHLGSNTRALVSQNGRHLFVTLWTLHADSSLQGRAAGVAFGKDVCDLVPEYKNALVECLKGSITRDSHILFFYKVIFFNICPWFCIGCIEILKYRFAFYFDDTTFGM